MQLTQIFVYTILFTTVGCVHARETERKPQGERLYVSEEICGRGLFTKGIEGPAVDKLGNIYAVNFQKRGTIGKIAPGRSPELWAELPDNGVSASIHFGPGGGMFVADYRNHRIYAVDQASKAFKLYFQDPTLHQPNDFTITRDRSMYLSDPTWNKNKRGHIVKVRPDGTSIKLKDDLRTPNGIDLSPDETKLYYTDSVQGAVYVFDIQGEHLENRRTLATYETDTVDGLRTDIMGNIFIARIKMGVVDQLSSNGTLIRRIQLVGKEPSNLTFGGPDGRTMYVTLVDNGNIEAFQVEHPGREWSLAH